VELRKPEIELITFASLMQVQFMSKCRLILISMKITKILRPKLTYFAL